MIGIIKGVLGLGSVWLEGRQEVSRQKAENKRAEIKAQSEAKQKVLDNEGAWERLHAEGAQDSWKDEAWTLFFIGLLCVGFWPDSKAWLDQWVAYVNALPEWVSIGIIISVSASFGIRGIDKFKGWTK